MKKTTQQIKAIALGIAVALGASYAFAWTGPTTTPPGGNVAAPLNVSSATQTKLGNLVLNGLSVATASIFTGTVQLDLGTPVAGEVLTAADASGTAEWSSAGVSGDVPSNVVTFTTSGTWTVPSGVTRIRVRAWGAGGAGGAGSGGSIGSYGCCGSGGGGGGYAEGILSIPTGTNSLTVTVGAGGSVNSSGSEGKGGSGGQSGVSTIVAYGGSGGNSQDNGSTANSGGMGGTASGSIALTGQKGQSFSASPDGNFGGQGGASGFGGAGGITNSTGGVPNNLSTAGATPGGGGSGGDNSGSDPGSTGGSGMVVIEY